MASWSAERDRIQKGEASPWFALRCSPPPQPKGTPLKNPGLLCKKITPGKAQRRLSIGMSSFRIESGACATLILYATNC